MTDRTLRPRIALSLLAAIVLLAGFGCKGVSKEVKEASKPFTLSYWRVFDDVDVLRPALQKYQALHPNIHIDYRKFTSTEYENELLEALAEDKGPDVMSLHHTWLTRWQPRLFPVPNVLNVTYQEVQGTLKKETVTVLKQIPGMTVKKLAADFLPVVSQDVILLTEQADPRAPLVPRVYGLPLSMDTMVLFYNRDMLNEAGIASPATDWKSFQDQVKLITRLDETGAIIRSAAALGTADNVDRASDIVSLLMMQNGAPMSSEAGTATFDKYPPELAGRQYPPGAEALIFYTDFANPTKEVYTWNDKMPTAFEAFVTGKTAYFFGYSYHLPIIRRSNPKLNFAITTFPQIANNPPVNNANYWVEAVSNKSDHPEQAWEFLQFITAAEQTESFLNATRRPTALNALVSKQLEDLDLGAFAAQLPNVRSWYHGQDTAAMEDAFDEMVRQALAEEADPGKIVELGATKVNQTIR